MISTLRICAVALAGVLTALIGWVVVNAGFLDGFTRIAADPWGLVALLDLYLGFLIISVVIWLFETDRRTALLWIVPI